MYIMKAVVEIDIKTLQAQQLLNYIETLPFARVKTERVQTQNPWNEAIAAGAVSLDEFDAKFRHEIYKAYKI